MQNIVQTNANICQALLPENTNRGHLLKVEHKQSITGHLLKVEHKQSITGHLLKVEHKQSNHYIHYYIVDGQQSPGQDQLGSHIHYIDYAVEKTEFLPLKSNRSCKNLVPDQGRLIQHITV